MKLCFDIGANVGIKTEKLVEKFDKVIAFEPNPKLVSFLNEKFSDKNVVVDSRAISNKNGIQKFMISDYDNLSTLSKKWVTESRFTNFYSWDTSIKVTTLTLNDAIIEYGSPNFVKIDVEGYECEILESFDKLISNCTFCFEYVEENKYRIKKTINHLNRIGYSTFSFIHGDELIFDINLSWQNYDRFCNLDFMDDDSSDKWGMIYFKK